MFLCERGCQAIESLLSARCIWAEVREGTPPGCFSAKSLELIEKTGDRVLRSAKKCREMQKSAVASDEWREKEKQIPRGA
jgi:hypothetical protein